MENDVALPAGMVRHKESGTLYLRLRIPQDVLQEYGGKKKEFHLSLKTKDVKEAKVRFYPKMNELERDFALKREKIRKAALSVPAKTKAVLSLDTIHTLVGKWFQQLEVQSINEDGRIIAKDSFVDDVISDLVFDLGFLYENSRDELQMSSTAIEDFKKRVTTDILQPNGFNIEIDTETTEIIARLMVRGMIENRKRAMHRLAKRSTVLSFPQDWDEQLVKSKPDAFFISLSETSKEVVVDSSTLKVSMLLKDASKAYSKQIRKEENNMSPKTIRDYDGAMKLLKLFFGETTTLHTITSHKYEEFLETIYDLPPRYHDVMRINKIDSLPDVIKWREEKKLVKIADRTRERYFTITHGFFNYAKGKKWIVENPAEGMRQCVPHYFKITGRGRKRMTYDEERLNMLFSSRIYKEQAKDNITNCLYWIPLIGLFTGCRENEIASAFIDDIPLSNKKLTF